MQEPLPLAGVRVIEAASFVAAPSACMAMAQLGADVIRIDPPGGGSDVNRWPLSTAGPSLFWAGLNKGKRSVAIDHRRPEGRELVMALATLPGDTSGVFVDNMVGRRRIRYEDLRARRPDVIHVHVQGRSDGQPAVDYTVNAEVGVPGMTGPEDREQPVNHVVPAWDLLTGMTAAAHLVAALWRRRTSGTGAQIELALLDVALAGVGSMGWIAEAEQNATPRPRHGNHMFGSFGVDFATRDGRRVMVAALTEGQWRSLREVTDTIAVFRALEEALDADLDVEGDRYRLRETIAAVLRPWFAQRDFPTVRDALDRAHVLWGPYLDMVEVAGRARDAGGVVSEIHQPGIGLMLASGSPVRWDGLEGAVARPAPVLGEDTGAILRELLGLSDTEVDGLVRTGVVSITGQGVT